VKDDILKSSSQSPHNQHHQHHHHHHIFLHEAPLLSNTVRAMMSSQRKEFQIAHPFLRSLALPLNEDETVGFARLTRVVNDSPLSSIVSNVREELKLECLKVELVWGKQLISIHKNDLEKLCDVIVALLRHGCKIYLQDGTDTNLEPEDAERYAAFAYCNDTM
jgi:hypothetical protein